MKFLRELFLVLTSLAAGLIAGVCLTAKTAMDSELCILIASIAGGISLILTIVFAVAIARNNQARLNLKVSLQKKDTVLQAGVEYIVKKRGTVRPGEYSVLATDENNKSFTVRVNDYVKEYTHNTTLILSEGDRISARSCNIILR